MNPIARVRGTSFLTVAACLALAVPIWAATQYLGDGAIQNTRGGFDLPPQGTCPAGTPNGYAGIDTRPECTALRLNIVQASCTSPNYAWTTSGVCNDLVHATQASCEAAPDRLWNPATGVCAIVMMDDDRNDVTCMTHGGTWVTAGTCTGNWVMPARTAYNPPLLSGNGPGDQCLRCHNTRTQYNSPRVRDTEDTMFMGHKNMARPVTPGIGWGGPDFECTIGPYASEEACYDGGGNWVPIELYPADDAGNPFDWNTGRSTTATGTWDVAWIYGDWLGPLPRTIIKTDPSASLVCTDPRGNASNCVGTYGGTMVANAGASYSCARCHTTGWTSDAAIMNAAGIEGKEPEITFPGITWDRNSAAGFGVVNLSSGVSGDAHKTASWDVWGVSCTRCHNSAIDTTNVVAGSSPPEYNAPAGMSRHHSNMTAPDINSGACSDLRFTALTQCLANGGEWLTACSVNPTPAICTTSATTAAACTSPNTWVPVPGFCSNAFYDFQASCIAQGTCSNAAYSTQATCTGGGATWTPLTWTDGFCRAADPTGTTCAGGATYRTDGTVQSCLVAGASWDFPKCNVAGACNLGDTYTTAQTCSDAGGQWRFANDVIRCEDAGGKWTGNNANRGQLITRLCMDCHHQETAGLPFGATSTDGVNVDYTNAFPSTNLKVGQYHSTVTFISHPHGNQYLNSPHAKFQPIATFDKIGTGKFNFAMTGEYRSFFLTEAEAANTGNGCTGCHEVHTSTVTGEEPFRQECTECHSGPYKKDLHAINHLWGKGTPMENAALNESSACESCHMPQGLHLWRINADPGYSTYPPGLATATSAAACTALGGTWSASSGCTNVNANTAPEGTYTNAVWVDVDLACGQCHGGGSSHAATTGTIATGSKALTVTSAAGFVVGQRIRVADAGSFTYEDGGPVRGDFDTYIASIAGNTINLIGGAPIGATNVAVAQNPTSLVEPGRYAPYYTKAQLAAVAQGMHASGAVNYPATFTTAIDPGNSLMVHVDASVECGGPCPTFTYGWDWGDGTLPGTGDPATHTYAAPGTYLITLTVREAGLIVGSSSRSQTVNATDLPPVAAATCAWFPNTWTMAVVDASTDEDMGTLQVIVDWGDGGVRSNIPPGGSTSKVYGLAGSFSVTVRAIDRNLHASVYTCPAPATPTYFSIRGTVFASNGTTPLGGAVVTLYKNGIGQKSATSALDGTYTLPALRPGTYSIKVTRAGYRFADPAIASVNVGPNSVNQNISASGVLSTKPVNGQRLSPK